jgi:hypothetical protein
VRRISLGIIILVGIVGFFLRTFDTGRVSSLWKTRSSSDIESKQLEQAAQSSTYVLQIEMARDLSRYHGLEALEYRNSTGTELQELLFQLPPNARRYRADGRKNLQIQSVSVDGRPIAATESESGFVLRVALPEPLKNGSRMQLILEFEGSVPRLSKALSASSRTFGLSDGIVCLAHWYPIVPAFAGKHFDSTDPPDFGDLANFEAADYDVTLRTADPLVAAASGAADAPVREGATTRQRFRGSALREFSLCAARDWKKQSVSIDSTEINIFSRLGESHKTKEISRISAHALQYFSELFGPYPWKKLDIAFVPLGKTASGMEYSGLITLNERLLHNGGWRTVLSFILVSFFGSSPGENRRLEFALAHEIAHQWWHGLVGSNEKHSPFLDESLANYSAVLFLEHEYGKEDTEAQSYVQLQARYILSRLRGYSDKPAWAGLRSFESGEQYAGMVYGKGALFLKALRQMSGDTLFFSLLRNYASSNAFGRATRGSWEQAVEEALSRDPAKRISMGMFLELEHEWLDQARGDQQIGTALRLDLLAEAVLGPHIFSGTGGAELRALLSSAGLLTSFRLRKHEAAAALSAN